VRAVLDGKACWIEGNATPFGMYVKLYKHRDQFVVIDDVDALYADRSGVRLFKCLWGKSAGKSGVSSSFLPDKMNRHRGEIRCRFIILARGNPVSVHHSCPKR
jgi:hypothetical protein